MKRIGCLLLSYLLFSAINAQITNSIVDVRNGQNYKIVKIGGQWWMAENLNIGIRIDAAQDAADNELIEKYCYNNDTNNCSTYGGLYHWSEMMGYNNSDNGNPGLTQGICPAGWHLPTNDEWTELVNFLGGEYVAGGKLKETGTVHWSSPNTGANNESGFTALAGGYLDDARKFFTMGHSGYWWSSTKETESTAYYWCIFYSLENIYGYDRLLKWGHSARCLIDTSQFGFLTISDKNFKTISKLEYLDNRATKTIVITNTGVINTINVVSIQTNTSAYYPDKSSVVLSPGESIQINIAFNPPVKGIFYHDTLSVRSDDPYLPEISVPLNGLMNTDSIIDSRDGQVYSIVKIGEQWWMAENMNIGTQISESQDASDNGVIEKYCYGDYANFCNTYGGSYQWNEMMDYEPSDNGINGTTRGICPEGWHLPTVSEWDALIGFLGGESVAGGKIKQTGTSLWFEPNTGATNESGFTALPGGYRMVEGISEGIHFYSYLWTSTEGNSTSSMKQMLRNSSAGIERILSGKTTGSSVRCIRDACQLTVNTNYSEYICPGINDGFIHLYPAGGTPPYYYSWKHGEEMQIISDLPAGNYSATVYDKYGCRDSATFMIKTSEPYEEQKICIVTVDPATGKNILVWDNTQDAGIASYNIYREAGIGQYETIGTRNAGELSIFRDETSNPKNRSYVYKITVTDTCGNESSRENTLYHWPSFLQYDGQEGGVNLSWTDYKIEGVDYIGDYLTSYVIYRGTDSTGLSEYQSVGRQLNFTDTDPDALTRRYYYRVAGVLKDPCYPSTGKKADSGPYSQSMSNIEDNRFQVGIKDGFNTGKFISIIPNPFSENTILKFSNPEGYQYKLNILDLSGKICRTINDITASEYVLEKGDLKEGFYFVELRGPCIYRGKIIIE